MFDMPEFDIPDDEKDVGCHNSRCKWKGKLKDAKQKEVSSPHSAWLALGGREGWHWHCPRCGFIVESYYTKMS